MTARGDDRKLWNLLARQGYTVMKARSGHWHVYDTTGQLLLSTSGTPSDWRARKNLIKQLGKLT